MHGNIRFHVCYMSLTAHHSKLNMEIHRGVLGENRLRMFLKKAKSKHLIWTPQKHFQTLHIHVFGVVAKEL